MSTLQLAQHAGLYWSICNFAVAGLCYYLYLVLGLRSSLYYALGHLCAAVWGVTLPFLKNPTMLFVNSIVLPILAGSLFLAGCIAYIRHHKRTGEL